MDFNLQMRMAQNYQKNLHMEDVFAVHPFKKAEELRIYIFEAKFSTHEKTHTYVHGNYD